MSVVSRHLACLKDCGVLDSQKSGKEVFYSLNAGSIATLLRAMADMIEGVNAQTPNETATQPKGEIP
jgi:DNA-binding transcriptional ArsR family regulator